MHACLPVGCNYTFTIAPLKEDIGVKKSPADGFPYRVDSRYILFRVPGLHGFEEEEQQQQATMFKSHEEFTSRECKRRVMYFSANRNKERSRNRIYSLHCL